MGGFVECAVETQVPRGGRESGSWGKVRRTSQFVTSLSFPDRPSSSAKPSPTSLERSLNKPLRTLVNRPLAVCRVSSLIDPLRGDHRFSFLFHRPTAQSRLSSLASPLSPSGSMSNSTVTRHGPGICAMRGGCGKKSIFDPELPCPDDGDANEVSMHFS